MKNGCIALVLVCMMAVSCESGSALQFNQDVVQLESGLDIAVTEAEQKIGLYAGQSKMDSVAAVAGRMEQLVADRLYTLENISTPDVKLAKEFKEAFVAYLGFIKNIYTGYKKIGLAVTEEGRAKEQALLEKVVEKRDEVRIRVQTVQRQFAQANGFKIRQNDKNK